jgi:hypothetical protein
MPHASTSQACMRKLTFSVAASFILDLKSVQFQDEFYRASAGGLHTGGVALKVCVDAAESPF